MKIFRGFFRNGKGITIENLGSYALAFGVAVIIVAIVAQVLGQIRTTQNTSCIAPDVNLTGCKTEYNITTKGLEGTATLGNWFPTIATIIAAVVVIVLIISGFRFGGTFEGF